jgi:hypothetical protein
VFWYSTASLPLSLYRETTALKPTARFYSEGTVNTTVELRDRVLAEIRRLELLHKDGSKTACRLLHAPAVQIELERNREWIKRQYPRYAQYFANGLDVRPSAVRPILIEVSESWHADLFRMARLTWALPFTRGYGRRLRFLVMDSANEKLIGILGMQSPPLDFPARDRLFAYPKDRKVELVNQTMDIFTLGAVPPYGRLLGGKLIALAAVSDEVRRAYERRYKHRATEMNERILPARLVALTTTSAFGRSSLYNRLVYQERLIAQSIGYTEGYGSFHLAPVYSAIKEFLEEQGVSTQGGFGVGPRRVWQNYVRALARLGLSGDLLKHGVKREVFLFPLAKNLGNYMEGRAGRPVYFHQSFSDLAAWWRERWLLARAERVDGWHTWDKSEIERLLIGENPQT